MSLESLYGACIANVTALTRQYKNLSAEFEEHCHHCDDDDPCAQLFKGDKEFNPGFHVAALFIMLIVSALGVLLPLVAKYNPETIRVEPFAIILGKCAGTGVILSCALIHMIFPSNQSLTSECVPSVFNADYEAFGFLVALISALFMHFLEFILSQSAGDFAVHSHSLKRLESSSVTTDAAGTVAAKTTTTAGVPVVEEDDANRQQECTPDGAPAVGATTIAAVASRSTTTAATTTTLGNKTEDQTAIHHQTNFIELNFNGKKLAEAYMVECGIAVHSVLIGLAVGVKDQSGLTPLLVAMSFHQFFEGMALGSRLAAADFGMTHEMLLAAGFAIAAPVGIAVAIEIYNVLNTNGETFLLVQGILDGVCGGLLLYTGFVFLLRDFPQDLEDHCRGRKHQRWRQAAMFFTLWVFAGVMSLLGKYL